MSPSEFYRQIRPDKFSDSELVQEAILTRELLAFELSQITINQKQDQFETLSRRLAEKFLAPNLIPQVGPTGGGDGKTDSETHPVSESITNRWFTPEKGWDNDEKWAFAFSAKREWKPKLKLDIKSILSTERGYTKIFFFTNQTPSSKQKKDAQDQFKKEFKIDIEIFDAEWILEKTINNSEIVDLVVDALSLSAIYKSTIIVGSKDAVRLKRLTELEENIQSGNRYFEYDFQLVEDALESAIISRELEKSRDEVEGRFSRALKLAKKVKNNGQLVRIRYQRAWTQANWYDDFNSFHNEFRKFKKLLNKTSSISEAELYFSLFSILKGIIIRGGLKKVSLTKETDLINGYLQNFVGNKSKPSSSLIARTFVIFLELSEALEKNRTPDHFFEKLSIIMKESKEHIEYPFEMFSGILERYGDIFTDNSKYDSLLDILAELSASRISELSTAQIFIRRGAQKYSGKLFKESIVYFGKALMRVAKEETKHGFYLACMGLSMAYKSLGLVWASHQCLVAGSSVPMREWGEKGLIDERLYRSVKQIIVNEIFIGRIPIFLLWNELGDVISAQLNKNPEDEGELAKSFLDASLSVRLIDSEQNNANEFGYLSSLLEENGLWLSQHSVLYALGHTEPLLNDYRYLDIINEKGLNDFFEKVAHQPVKKQMLYDTNFLASDLAQFRSRILGAYFNVSFDKDEVLFLFAEAILAYFESFLATSSQQIIPSTESINIRLLRNDKHESILIKDLEKSNEYLIEVSQNYSLTANMDTLLKEVISLLIKMLGKNFHLNNPEEHFTNLFKSDEVDQRCALIFNHSNYSKNILGDSPKLFMDNWLSGKNFSKLEKIRDIPFEISNEKVVEPERDEDELNFDQAKHNDQRVVSIIDDDLWNQAKWRAFGFFFDRYESSLGIILTFENEVAGKEIFNGWIDRFGDEDNEEILKITVIRGADKKNPAWYRVHITNNMDAEKLKKQERFIITSARFHEMNAASSENLDHLIQLYQQFKKYMLCPAKLNSDGSLEPFTDKAILKKELHIKNAWEIGLNDLERSAIRPDDQPVIPVHVKNAPVLEVLKYLKENRDR